MAGEVAWIGMIASELDSELMVEHSRLCGALGGEILARRLGRAVPGWGAACPWAVPALVAERAPFEAAEAMSRSG
jgi:hypothetical protein